MFEDYEIYCRAAGLRPETIKLRMRWLTRAHREVDLMEATPRMLLDWLASHEWAPETRKSARSCLRSFYQWAVEAEVCPLDPSLRLPSVRVPGGVPKPAPTAVLRAALERATDRDRLIIGLAGFAGLRRTEIATLPWSGVQWHGLRVVGKGGRCRTLPMLPDLREMLDRERALRERCEVGSGWRYEVDPRSDYVLPSHLGGHMSPFTVGRVLTEALGEGWTGHTLRHRFATKAYAVDRDLLTVQQLLGHSNPQTTARYTAVPHGAAAAAVAGAAA